MTESEYFYKVCADLDEAKLVAAKLLDELNVRKVLIVDLPEWLKNKHYKNGKT